MTLINKIRDNINLIPVGNTFGYKDLKIKTDEYSSAAKALERLQKEGTIKKVSKGVFYKPVQTIFGELKPEYNTLLQPYLFENGKRIAYETGISLYNRMGLTTQVPFRIKIASRKKRIYINRDALIADAVKSYAEVTGDNFEILGLLDAFKDIKQIPDCSISQAVKVLSGILNQLSIKQIENLIKYALNYPPRVRALVGAILENQEKEITLLEKLKNSLNPLTSIKLQLKEQDLATIKNWNIE